MAFIFVVFFFCIVFVFFFKQKTAYEISAFFFFKQKTAYEIGVRLVGSEMCIRDSLLISPPSPLTMESHGETGSPRRKRIALCIGKEVFAMIKTIGFLGCGNMGGAIARAVCKAADPQNVYLANRTASKAEKLAGELGCNTATNAGVAAR